MQLSIELLAMMGTAQAAAIGSRRSSASSSSSFEPQEALEAVEPLESPVSDTFSFLGLIKRQRPKAVTTTAAAVRPAAATTSPPAGRQPAASTPASSSRSASSSAVSSVSSRRSSSSSVASFTGPSTSATSSTNPASSIKVSTILAASSSSTTKITSSFSLRTSSSQTSFSSAKASATASIKALELQPSSTRAAASSTRSAAPLTTTLIDWGCWQDSTSARTFTGPEYTSGDGMSIDSCAAFCSSKGMPFSGTEYASECHCSLTAPTSAQAWWCNMPCTGNSNQICGSGNAMSVYYSAAQDTSAGFKDLGCVADSANSRTLTGPTYKSANMSNGACSAFCNSQGYDVSGTEYGSECYCSKTLPWAAPVGCSMACSGNPGEICGDGNALSIRVRGNSPLLAATNSTAANRTSEFSDRIDLNQKFENWSTWKSRGTNLGNWLVLERWMWPTWFDQASGNAGAVDEWTFCQTLGEAACTTQLQQHWASWVTQDEIATLANAGANTLRIPIGFWAFLEPLAGEPYVKSTQLQEVSRILGYAKQYGMTVILDLHALPGSQNGKDHSGHIGDIGWYTSANQQRSLQLVQAAANWIASSGYAGTISALEVANEPAIANWDQWLMYKDFVLASYAIIKQTIPSVTTMFHDGFWPLEPWNHFFSASDNVVLDTHKYFAFAETTLAQAISDVCAYVEDFNKMNMPVLVGEFSLSIDTPDPSSAAQTAVEFFQTQMQAWIQSAGGVMWSHKATDDQGNQNLAWSTLGLIQSGLFSGPNFWDLAGAKCASAA